MGVAHVIYPPDRAALLRLLPTGGAVAELGVLRGDFAAKIIEVCRPRVLYLVDTWYATRAPHVGLHGRYVPTGESWDDVYRGVVARFAGRAVITRRGSLSWLNAQAANSLDWVYIDTTHTFRQTCAELYAARRVVRPGGYICGHDYSAVFPGVIIAVEEFCRETGLELKVLTTERPTPFIKESHWTPLVAALDSYAIEVK